MAMSEPKEAVLHIADPKEQAKKRAQVATWLQIHRTRLRLKQQDVAVALQKRGLRVSRGHYANLERGKYEVTHEQAIALDQIFEGHGELLSLAGVQDIRDDWAELGRRLDRLLAGSVSQAPPVGDLDYEEWLNSIDEERSLTIKGSSEVKLALTALLSIAANKKNPWERGSIEFAGTFEGLRSDPERAGLPTSARDALRTAMENGWSCLHYIPLRPREKERASILHVAFPLSACPNFEARLVDLESTSSVEHMMIIPEFVAVQFYATSDPAHIDAAVIHRSERDRRLLEERAKQLRLISDPFVTRYERSDPANLQLSREEAKFRRLLRATAEIEGPCRLWIGSFPTATVPNAIYKKSVIRRSKEAHTEGDKVWTEMIQLQAERVRLLKEHLEKRISYRVLLTQDDLEMFADRNSEPDVESSFGFLDKTERNEHLEHVLHLLKTQPTFEVGIAPDSAHMQLSTCRWEVRGGPQGVAVVRTEFTLPHRRRLKDGPTKRRVDLRIGARAAVRAFMAYFDDIWRESLTKPDDVTGVLKDIGRRLQP